MASGDETDLHPAWDAGPDEPVVLPVEDQFDRTGIAGLQSPARFTISCLGLYVAFRLIGLLAAGFVESAQQTSRDLVYGDIFRIALDLWGMAGLVMLGFGLPLVICTALGFLTWLIGAAHNAEAIADVDLRISPGWQAGWYFIPFFHLIVPVIGMMEIVSHSQLRRPDSTLVITLVWWGTWVMGTFGIYLLRITRPPLAFEANPSMYFTILDVSAAILGSCAAVLLIILIRRVTNAQSAVAKRWMANEEDPFQNSELS